ncbi:DNA cytosine methyltransferase [Lihuaxuella thermophila]|uniref:Cytosine-specific methyltransferase n=1 Tax=Lihuaxuella thermophila TaxID=1173111 RepID=A0A1H8JQ81_9BACL|nr:DNA cytosine methyltransferase [Lihuaxuella thermophila]SEN82675.1 DNA (cytosine-5)-methyltransferase 1 [Lihuaxuella thermophila]
MTYWELKKANRYELYCKYLKGEISREKLYTQLPEEYKNIVINREISQETIVQIFETIDSNMNILGEKSVDIIIGGPPCQAYSLVGRARDPHGKKNDPRNYLYKQYIKFLEKYKPKMFVFENVPGIFSANNGALFEEMKKDIQSLGYTLEGKILDASKHGVLQQRKRVILIGWMNGSNLGFPDIEEVTHNHQVSELLLDLPPLEPGESYRWCNYIREASSYLVEAGIREDDFVTQHISRTHNERDRKIYKLVIEAWERDKRRLKYTDLPSELRTHKNLRSFLDRFKVVAADLPFCHTMVAHISKDGHYYIHPDITQLRSLSVREAARIQSFPDNYYFEGSRTAMFTQIGNAVPPILSEKIAIGVMEELKKLS